MDGINPLRGISRLLTERVPGDRHHGRGAAHFLASFIAVVNKVTFASCIMHVMEVIAV